MEFNRDRLPNIRKMTSKANSSQVAGNAQSALISGIIAAVWPENGHLRTWLDLRERTQNEQDGGDVLYVLGGRADLTRPVTRRAVGVSARRVLIERDRSIVTTGTTARWRLVTGPKPATFAQRRRLDD